DSVLNNGAVPQWNPYIFGGLPFVEAFHGDLFYPLSMIKYFGELYRMLGMILFWHIFLAGIFMYLCARQFKLEKIPSLLAGITYMFAPYLVAMVSPWHDGKIFVTALFPLTVLFLERGFESKTGFKSFFNFSMMGLIIGFIILSPHPQMSYFALWALGFYTLYKLIINYVKNKNVVRLIRPASLAVYAVVIGLLLSAIQFYPGYNYTTNFSPRTDRSSGWEWATSWSMHEEEAFSLLIPEFSGTSSKNEKTVYWGKNSFKDNSESISVVAIFLALIGLFFSRKKKVYFFGGLALFALLYALGATTPFFHLFYLIPKVSSMRAPSMIMFLFTFSISLIAAYGLQWLMTSTAKPVIPNKKFNYLLWGMPSFMFLLAILLTASGRGMISIWSSLFYSDLTQPIGRGYSKLDLAYNNLPSIQSGAWWSFLAIIAVAVIIWLYKSGKAGKSIFLVLLLIPMFNDIRFDKRFISTVDPTPYWQPNVLVDYFNKQPGNYRVMNFTRAVSKNYLPQYGIPVIEGYHGNQLNWYDKLMAYNKNRGMANPRLLNLSCAKYIMVPGNQQLDANYFGEKLLTQAADFGQVKIMKNDNVFPRTFLVDQYQIFENPDQIRKELFDGNTNLRNTVLLEKEPQLNIERDSLSKDSAWISDYQTDSVTINLNVTKNKLLVLTDNFFESWHAEIDGNPAEILKAYSTYRAVAIPAGSKQIIFRYSSEKYHTGKLLTQVVSIYLLLIIGLFFFKGFKEK
ncbi:MAG: hypothetical protein U9N54_07605, partial [candidate division Zixibacteria bacterium]|nr:hypothetical protein [candidate division Zixibacteria bacterium]